MFETSSAPLLERLGAGPELATEAVDSGVARATPGRSLAQSPLRTEQGGASRSDLRFSRRVTLALNSDPEGRRWTWV